jgi:hypothetical protein
MPAQEFMNEYCRMHCMVGLDFLKQQVPFV